MFLGDPVFPISFQLEQVAEAIEKALKKKNWKAFEKGEIKLVLSPFYIFYYDAAFEEGGKPKEETAHGRLALNARTAELNKELAESMPEEAELANELPDTYPLIVRKPIFSKSEAEKIALLKTASYLKTDKANVVLSDFKMVYYPMWLAFATVGKETYQLEISAISGKVFGEEKVPSREKGFVEVTKETLKELKQPGAWLKYSKEIGGIAADKISKGERPGKKPAMKMPSFRKRPWFWLTVVLIIILILLLALWA